MIETAGNRIATPPEEDRATAIRNTHNKFGEDCTRSFGDMLAYKQTHKTDTLMTILAPLLEAE